MAQSGKQTVTIVLFLVFIASLTGWLLLSRYSATNDKNSSNIILRVGQENITQAFYDYELKQYPAAARGSNLDKVIKDKLVEDSIVLQAGLRDNIISQEELGLDPSKEGYQKRLSLVNKVKSTIESKSDSISGEIISIWFYNNELGILGYEQGKSLAKSKIESTYKEVSGRQLTMKGAAERLKQDPDIKKLDPTSYQSNVYLEFKNKNPADKITFDAEFDNKIRNTNINDFTDVSLLRGVPGMDETEVTDIVYAFAFINEKNHNNAIKSYESWLYAEKEKVKVDELN